MLKLLNIKVNGYKLLEDNFTFDFLTRTKVLEADLEKEVLKIDNVLYSFRTLAIVGGNSSGKSTVLALILKTIDFLSSGRWNYVENEFKFDINTEGDESNYVTEAMKKVYNYLENQTLENYEKLYKYQKQHLVSEGILTHSKRFEYSLFGKIVNKFKKFII